MSSVTWPQGTSLPVGTQATSVAASKPRPQAPLNPSRIVWHVATILALLLLNIVGNWGAGVFFAILAAMALRGPESALKAMAICYLGLVTNDAFVPKSLVWTPARLALPALCLVRVAFDLIVTSGAMRASATYVCFLLFISTMTVGSILSGWYTHIALLKILNFTVCLSAIFASVRMLRLRQTDISEWFVSLIVCSSIVGVLSVLLGQSSNFITIRAGAAAELLPATSLFNGAFSHPNSHSMMGSMFFMFGLLIAIFSRYRRRYIGTLLAILWAVFILLSQSRTAVAASLIPGIVMVLLTARHVDRSGATLIPRIRRSSLLMVGLAAFAGLTVVDLATGNPMWKSAVKFAHKWETSEDEDLDLSKVMRSRQGLIDSSWSNFLESPIYGIGFGVAKTEAFVQMATLFTAPAEKGFLPTAILEEGGIMGTTAFVLFIGSLLGTLYREKNIPGLVMVLDFLVSNFGEVSIFSPGGAGGFGWVMVGAATILGDHCWDRRRPPHTAVRPGGLQSATVGIPIAA